MRSQVLEEIGDYIILDSLGEGILGSMYHVQHRFLKQHHLLKVFPKEVSHNPAFIQRLREEISSLARLHHPNILKIENVSSDSESYFLVCEMHGKGKTLADLKDHPFDEEEIFKIATQVAGALDYVHNQSFHGAPLSHRGLNLHTILYDEGSIKISDFGLTQMVGIEAVLTKTYEKLWHQIQKQPLDHLGARFSNYYAFLSPELKKSPISSPELEVKADIYSFGILLYYLLTGKYPEGLFSMPSECQITLKKDWDSLIKKCLQNEPLNDRGGR